MMLSSKRKNVAKIVAAASCAVFFPTPATYELHGECDFLVMENVQHGLKSNFIGSKLLSRVWAPIARNYLVPLKNSLAARLEPLKRNWLRLANSDLGRNTVRLMRRAYDKVSICCNGTKCCQSPELDQIYANGYTGSKEPETHFRILANLDEDTGNLYTSLNGEQRDKLIYEFVHGGVLAYFLPSERKIKIIMDFLFNEKARDITALLTTLPDDIQFFFKIEDPKLKKFFPGKSEIDSIFFHGMQAIKKAEKPEGKVPERLLNFLKEVVQHRMSSKDYANFELISGEYDFLEGVCESDRKRIMDIIHPRQFCGFTY